jgi:hypothetical protein
MGKLAEGKAFYINSVGHRPTKRDRTVIESLQGRHPNGICGYRISPRWGFRFWCGASFFHRALPDADDARLAALP